MNLKSWPKMMMFNWSVGVEILPCRGAGRLELGTTRGTDSAGLGVGYLSGPKAEGAWVLHVAIVHDQGPVGRSWAVCM